MKIGMKTIALLFAVIALPAQIRLGDIAGIQATPRRVQINVLARDKNGPVRGLTKDDFTILEKGKPQKIAAFSENSVNTPGKPAAPLPADVFTNRPAENPASITIVLLDGLNTFWDQHETPKRLVEFLRQLQPQDRVGVYVLGADRLHVLQEFTGDSQALVGALAEFTGLMDRSNSPFQGRLDPGIPDLQCTDVEGRASCFTLAVQAIERHLARTPGRKNLIWVSGRFPITIETSDLAAYPVWIRSSVDDTSWRNSMRATATRTGGRAFGDPGHIATAIREVLKESEVNYTLAFDPDLGSADSTAHPIEVRVKRPGVALQCPTTYAAELDFPPMEQDRMNQIREAVASPLDATGIYLTAHLHRLDDTLPGLISIDVEAAPNEVALRQNGDRWAGTVDVVYTEKTAAGRLLVQISHVVQLTRNEQGNAAADKDGMWLSKTLLPIAGTEQIQIVVFDRTSGHFGSLTVPLHQSDAR